MQNSFCNFKMLSGTGARCSGGERDRLKLRSLKCGVELRTGIGKIEMVIFLQRGIEGRVGVPVEAR
jgi:hypothetical protein